MNSRTMSDQLTAGVIASLTYGVGAALHVARPSALVVPLTLYVVLIAAFALHGRQLRALQASPLRRSRADLAPTAPINAVPTDLTGTLNTGSTAGKPTTRPSLRRRWLHAA